MKECRRFSDMFLELNDGEAEPEAALEFENHMRGCNLCDQDYRQYSLTVEALRRLDTVAPPPDFLAQLNTRIDAVDSAPFFERIKSWLSPAPHLPLPVGAAALAVIAVLSILFYNQSVTSMIADSLPSGVIGTIAANTDTTHEIPSKPREANDLELMRPKSIAAGEPVSSPLETPSLNHPTYSRTLSQPIQSLPASTGPTYPTTADRLGADNLTVESPRIDTAVETIKQMMPHLRGKIVDIKPNGAVKEVLVGVVIPSHAYGDLTTRLIDFGAVEAGAGSQATPPKRSEGENVMLYIRLVPQP